MEKDKRTNPIITYDFTIIYRDESTFDKIMVFVEEQCKSYCFQLEKGEKTGLIHYQGRVKLNKRMRDHQAVAIFRKYGFSGEGQIEPTATVNINNCFYVTKQETRVKGPWMDKNAEEKVKKEAEKTYIPSHIQKIEYDNLYPYQKQVVDIANTYSERAINVIFDEIGATGKSTVAKYMYFKKISFEIPSCFETAKDFLRIVYQVPTARCYTIDIPRSVNAHNLRKLFEAIETVKGGYACDERYAFKYKYFDCPNIWVFTNTLPNMNFLTHDRWKIWKITYGNLTPYQPNKQEYTNFDNIGEGGIQSQRSFTQYIKEKESKTEIDITIENTYKWTSPQGPAMYNNISTLPAYGTDCKQSPFANPPGGFS